MKPQSMRLGFLTAAILAISTGSANATLYSFTDLGTNGRVGSINDVGQMSGISASEGFYRATRWNGSVPTVLGTLGGGGYSSANAINNAGQVAGYSWTATGEQHAVRWDETVAIDLGTPGRNSYAYAMNNAGQVAGYTTDANGNSVATRWDGLVAIQLGTLGGKTSTARGINDAGQAVGYAETVSGETHATRWDGAVAIDLGPVGLYSSGFAISSTGLVAGNISGWEGWDRAARWDGTVVTSLGESGTRSRTTAINAAGQVVGVTTGLNMSKTPTLWNTATAIDVNTLMDTATRTTGWVIKDVYGISDSGTITGSATNSKTGASGMFRLSEISAVPEPEGFAMMLGGLGGLGFLARRKSLQGTP